MNRVIRFLFGPISLLAILSLLNYYPQYMTINNLCFQRNICYSNCMNDNFPNLHCGQDNVALTYFENRYLNLFYYPANNGSNYAQCKGFIAQVS